MPNKEKKVAILQSNYIPWKGYFDLIARADVFVFLDVVQYTKGDWRNRNKIKTSQGQQWLTLPVKTSKRRWQQINEAELLHAHWIDKHLKSLMFNYRKAKCYEQTMEWLAPLYTRFRGERRLSAINQVLIRAICSRLDISTNIITADQFLIEGNKDNALLSILDQIGDVSHYITGPSAKSYLKEEYFEQRQIKVEWMDYNNYLPYKQLYPPFMHDVSILDLLFHQGDDSRSFLKY